MSRDREVRAMRDLLVINDNGYGYRPAAEEEIRQQGWVKAKWIEMYAEAIGRWATLLEHYDLGEDATADDIINAARSPDNFDLVWYECRLTAEASGFTFFGVSLIAAGEHWQASAINAGGQELDATGPTPMAAIESLTERLNKYHQEHFGSLPEIKVPNDTRSAEARAKAYSEGHRLGWEEAMADSRRVEREAFRRGFNAGRPYWGTDLTQAPETTSHSCPDCGHVHLSLAQGVAT